MAAAREPLPLDQGRHVYGVACLRDGELSCESTHTNADSAAEFPYPHADTDELDAPGYAYEDCYAHAHKDADTDRNRHAD